MPKRNSASPPRPEMVSAVNEMLAKLEQISPDPSLVGRCPELPGIVLDRVMSSPLDRAGSEYKQVGSDYEKLRSEYLKALAAHPLGRALALLAVGPAGVEAMEEGYSPSRTTGVTYESERPTRIQHQTYNCHHIIPKSLQPANAKLQVNHPSNFVLTNTTRRGRDQSQNPHHFWHSLLLHPQTHNAPTDRPIPVYTVRPLFPFYPPMTRGFRSVEELRKNLASLGSAPLPQIWEKRLLEFSKATGHKAYSVPKEYHAITQLFGNLFKTENKEPGTVEQMRTQLAERGAALAARFLPAGAYLNGKPLPHDHRPKGILPVIESNPTSDSTVPPLIAPKKTRTISESKKRAPRKAAVLTAVQPTI
jgi:hypothetical protein